MKSLFFAVFAVLIGFPSYAEFLYWQVAPELQAQNTGRTINAEYARVVAVNGENTQYLTVVGGLLDDDGWVDTGSGEGNMYAIDLEQLTDFNAYSFYIEFARWDAASDDLSITGFSNTSFQDAGPKTYADLQHANYIDNELTVTPSNYWHGEGYVSPEPTSGLLVLIGLGLLGLKRRREVLKA